MAIGDLQFGVVILGAGRSSRMGRPKLLLPWGHRTVIEHLIEQWVSIGASQIAVIVAADNESMANAVRGNHRTDAIINPNPDRGMFSSIRCAAEWPSWNPALTHWVISLGDQPHLRDTTLAALIDAARAEPQFIWQPAYQGHRRHPVVLPKRSFMDLARTRATDLKSFLESSFVARRAMDSDDPGLEVDLDTPDDYARAKKLAGLD